MRRQWQVKAARAWPEPTHGLWVDGNFEPRLEKIVGDLWGQLGTRQEATGPERLSQRGEHPDLGSRERSEGATKRGCKVGVLYLSEKGMIGLKRRRRR